MFLYFVGDKESERNEGKLINEFQFFTKYVFLYKVIFYLSYGHPLNQKYLLPRG